jgi:hypothetical protein
LQMSYMLSYMFQALSRKYSPRYKS